MITIDIQPTGPQPDPNRTPKTVTDPQKTVTKTPNRTPTGPQPDLTYSSEELSDLAGRSREVWRRNWYPALCQVAPEAKLKAPRRRYSALARELTSSLAQFLEDGTGSIADWVEIHRPRQAAARAEFARAEASAIQANGAIVPAAVAAGTGKQSAILAKFNHAAAVAAELLEGFDLEIDQIQAETAALDRQIDIQRIVAEEKLKFLQEKRLRAEIQAQLRQADQAKAEQRLVAEMEEFKGSL